MSIIPLDNWLIRLLIFIGSIWLVLFAILLTIRWFYVRKKISLWLTNLRIRHVVTIVTFASILLLEVVVAFRDIHALPKAPSLNNISEVLENLRSCTSLRVINSYFGRYFPVVGPRAENLVITNPVFVKRLVDVLESPKYELAPEYMQGGHLLTIESMYIYIYKDEMKMGRFRLISGKILEVGDLPSIPLLYVSSDEYLLDRARDAIGAGGDCSGRKNLDLYPY